MNYRKSVLVMFLGTSIEKIANDLPTEVAALPKIVVARDNDTLQYSEAVVPVSKFKIQTNRHHVVVANGGTAVQSWTVAEKLFNSIEGYTVLDVQRAGVVTLATRERLEPHYPDYLEVVRPGQGDGDFFEECVCRIPINNRYMYLRTGEFPSIEPRGLTFLGMGGEEFVNRVEEFPYSRPLPPPTEEEFKLIANLNADLILSVLNRVEPDPSATATVTANALARVGLETGAEIIAPFKEHVTYPDWQVDGVKLRSSMGIPQEDAESLKKFLEERGATVIENARHNEIVYLRAEIKLLCSPEQQWTLANALNHK